jgi:hypothetical protein
MFETLAVFQFARGSLKEDARSNICKQSARNERLREPARTRAICAERTSDMLETLAVFQFARSWLKAVAEPNICE